MLQLELCYEVECGVGLFIPATLRQSEWQQPHRRRWTADLGSTGEFGYVGRRLEYDEEKHTFLTPGFFPRLQVKKLMLTFSEFLCNSFAFPSRKLTSIARKTIDFILTNCNQSLLFEIKTSHKL